MISFNSRIYGVHLTRGVLGIIHTPLQEGLWPIYVLHRLSLDNSVEDLRKEFIRTNTSLQNQWDVGTPPNNYIPDEHLTWDFFNDNDEGV